MGLATSSGSTCCPSDRRTLPPIVRGPIDSYRAADTLRLGPHEFYLGDLVRALTFAVLCSEHATNNIGDRLAVLGCRPAALLATRFQPYHCHSKGPRRDVGQWQFVFAICLRFRYAPFPAIGPYANSDPGIGISAGMADKAGHT